MSSASEHYLSRLMPFIETALIHLTQFDSSLVDRAAAGTQVPDGYPGNKLPG